MDDRYEFDAGTNTYLADTDADGLNDPDDLYPLSGPCIQDIKKLGLTAWWVPVFDEEQKTWSASDLSETSGDQIGTMIGYDPEQEGKDMVTAPLGKDNYFSLNRGLNANSQYIQVDHYTTGPNNTKIEALNPPQKGPFTVAVTFKWDGEMASGVDRAVLFSKGSDSNAEYALFLTKDGRLQFILRRRVKEKCYIWIKGTWYQYLDNKVEVVSTEANLIQKNRIYHVVVTFGNEHMRIFVNGIQEIDYDVVNKHTTRSVDYWRYTDYLLPNQDPLTIGAILSDSGPRLPFKGAMLDIQYFTKEINSDDIKKMHQYGLCVPESTP